MELQSDRLVSPELALPVGPSGGCAGLREFLWDSGIIKCVSVCWDRYIHQSVCMHASVCVHAQVCIRVDYVSLCVFMCVCVHECMFRWIYASQCVYA